ncbi:MAG: hypothetical protein LBR81_01020 [Prevotellaceae bacterium]|jgi:hypothetical protein|nr:hypothetical protein [Prevotellaceae bacterium]
MFRPYRDFGTVYDPRNYSTTTSEAIGGDIGAGLYLKGGLNFNADFTKSESGRWTGSNGATRDLAFNASSGDLSSYEAVYFKNAGDFAVIDQHYFDKMQGFDPIRITLNRDGGMEKNYSKHSNSFANTTTQITGNKRDSRERRNQTMSYLTAEEAQKFGLEKTMYSYKAYGTTAGADTTSISRLDNNRKNHHISEITVTRPDGTRYVYGSQSYNYKQREVTFNAKHSNAKENRGLVRYSNTDASVGNENGIDRYYNSNELPAHATAYQLTGILSPDYVDKTGNGLTQDDLGNYTKFNYTQVYGGTNPYHWRNPYYADSANYQEGFKFKKSDDKGSYLYGEKEIKELHSIESKNYIAEFYYSPRNDAYDVKGETGGRGNNTLHKLDSIKLYNRFDRNTNKAAAEPLKTVHFDYDYSLCKGIPSYDEQKLGVPRDSKGAPLNEKNRFGKLTLKKIWFTYGNSKKGMLSPYLFTYSNTNPNYDLRAQDRWGSYKPNPATAPFNIESPYVEQNNPEAVNSRAAAWNLASVQLPSGGVIEVEYESDDYAFVQNKRASNMVKILGFSDKKNINNPADLKAALYESGLWSYDTYRYVYFEAPANDFDDFKRKYIGEGDDRIKELFYKVYTDVSSEEDYDYIMGYTNITNNSCGWNNGYGWIELTPERMDKATDGKINPIAKTAMQFVLVNSPDLYYKGGNSEDAYKNPGEALFRNMVSLIKDIQKLATGTYRAMAIDGFGRKIKPEMSYLRLMNPEYKKYGGGNRVKKLSINDNWASMSGNNTDNYSYGQSYQYSRTLTQAENGIAAGSTISSGVAGYEPFIGNEENPLRQPNSYTERHNWAPDNRFYQERPYGEMFFPSPSVGYSRVVVSSLKPEGIQTPGTGHSEHEFYTAKDFPVLIKEPYMGSRSDEPVQQKPNWLKKLLKVNVEDFVTASQSYAIELNDMHGKQKAQYIYAEGQSVPVSSVHYSYKTDATTGQLANKINSIDKNGKVEELWAGVEVDLVFDERENETRTIGGGADGNIDASPLPLFGIPGVIPSVWPSFHSEKTRFRSIAATKVITRYGILEETTAEDLGSRVTTKNMAWDKETGQILLTQTQNNFNDPVYSFTYPAHWGYSGMAPAYKNLGLRASKVNPDNISNPQSYFTAGDELYLEKNQNEGLYAWVKEVDNNGGKITLIDKAGEPVPAGEYYISLLRSGHRNRQSEPIGTVTSLTNPIQNRQINFANARVLNAGAVEFNDQWGESICEENAPATGNHANPYLTGATGNFRPQRSWVYLSKRAQSNSNRNTNLRTDGSYINFSPFWTSNGSAEWKKNTADWTFTSEVTLFSPYGFELENRDALGRYTAATYGYNNTLPTAVSANARYKEMVVGNFEDSQLGSEGQFEFKAANGTSTAPENTHSHTGRYSIRVTRGESPELNRAVSCEE